MEPIYGDASYGYFFWGEGDVSQLSDDDNLRYQRNESIRKVDEFYQAQEAAFRYFFQEDSVVSLEETLKYTKISHRHCLSRFSISGPEAQNRLLIQLGLVETIVFKQFMVLVESYRNGWLREKPAMGLVRNDIVANFQKFRNEGRPITTPDLIELAKHNNDWTPTESMISYSFFETPWTPIMAVREKF